MTQKGVLALSLGTTPVGSQDWLQVPGCEEQRGPLVAEGAASFRAGVLQPGSVLACASAQPCCLGLEIRPVWSRDGHAQPKSGCTLRGVAVRLAHPWQPPHIQECTQTCKTLESHNKRGRGNESRELVAGSWEMQGTWAG